MRTYNTPGTEFGELVNGADMPAALDLVIKECRKMKKRASEVPLEREVTVVIAARRMYTALRVTEKSLA